jgi:hypothetical protein
MTDYSDYRKWTEVEVRQDEEYLHDHEEYSPQDVFDLCKNLIEKAEQQGLEGCYLKFKSNMEPHEDWLGLPSVTAVGYRPLNQEEKEQLDFEDKVNQVAKEKGITPFEARNYLELKNKGVV